MSKKIKAFVIIILIIIGIVLAASYAGNQTPTTAPEGTLSSSRAAGVALPTTEAPVNDFTTSLSTIKGISIDTSIFSNPAYQALRDYPVALGTDTVGRPNPFAPIGSDAGAAVVTEVQFETLQPGKITATTAQFGAQAIVSDTAAASVVFEYGTSDLFGSATPPVVLAKNGTVLYAATALAPATTYFVRAVLAQGSSTTVGNTMTFTTLAR